MNNIIKKGGACVSNCQIGTQSPAGKPAGWVSTQPECCNTSGTCNAACCIGCYLVEPTVSALTSIIQAGGGSFTIPSSQNNGSIAGTPAIPLSYNGSQGGAGVSGAAQSLLGGTIFGMPSWLVLGGGAVLVLMFAMRR